MISVEDTGSVRYSLVLDTQARLRLPLGSPKTSPRTQEKHSVASLEF